VNELINSSFNCLKLRVEERKPRVKKTEIKPKRDYDGALQGAKKEIEESSGNHPYTIN
jgi:hypothetical protein